MAIRKMLIIPDGHRRWAREHNASYTDAYVAGGINATKLIEGIIEKNLCQKICLYLIASKNFDERQHENMNSIFSGVTHLFTLLQNSSVFDQVAWSFRGSLARVPPELADALKTLLNHSGRPAAAYEVEFLVDYSGERELRDALKAGTEDYADHLPFEIVLRTGRIVRLSDSPIWESARADMFLVDKLFPDVTMSDVEQIFSFYSEDKQARRNLARVEIEQKRINA